MTASKQLSPMMQQYADAKAVCGEAILLFRMGDFYEVFFEDAQIASRELGLALTSREKGENAIPMAGFPYHQLDTYLARLIAAGRRVAICDQVEEPAAAKGLVRREITRIVSRGTLTDDALLDPKEPNYLAALVPLITSGKTAQSQSGPWPLAWVELSTGQFYAAEIPRERLADEWARLQPVECLLPEGAEIPNAVLQSGTAVTRRPEWAFGPQFGLQTLQKHLGTRSLEGFGFGKDAGNGLRAAGALLDYLAETQKTSLAHIDRILPYHVGQRLEIDEATRKSLELHRTLRDANREGSLLSVMDKTVTSMGSRLMGEWLAAPLVSVSEIVSRQEAVEEFARSNSWRNSIRAELDGVYDLERLLARVATGRASPRDLSMVGRSLARLPQAKELASKGQTGKARQIAAGIDLCDELRTTLEQMLCDDCPLASKEGGIIRSGAHPPLDELRDLITGGKRWLAEYQAREIERTGIPNLKVGYNKVFGYYLEVTHSQGTKVPDGYHRKQTVKNAERYITPELKEHEDKVLSAEDQAQDLEYQLFLQLRDAVLAQSARLRATAAALAELDVLSALADLAVSRNYVRPQMTDEPRLDIVDGRHPVLDAKDVSGSFIPNDCTLGGDDGTVLLITGPNMAGKSTYIRQVALLCIMAQMGSFVPATRATVGVADRVFARVGASDDLARGQSTFMVEMIETARILHLAKERSLVILDEVGRGTSTYDGLSLAWAIVEYLHDQSQCRTLFATHYHELTDLARSLPRVRNANVAVREWQEEVVFLHKIVPGAADKSYGLHVARLAGVPPVVLERAKDVLSQLEADHLDSEGQSKMAKKNRGRREYQLTFFGMGEHPLIDEIRTLDVADTTPLVALQRIQAWQARLQAENGKNE